MNSPNAKIKVRDATADDAEQIRDIYLATYGEDYAYPKYYDVELLRKATYADDNILVVAVDQENDRVVGTASVLLDVGAYGDLAGEFGRLAVHPDARRCGIGRMLMEGRLARVADRLHVGLVDNRVAHPFSQKISLSHHFVPVGYMPKKLMLAQRESVCLFIRHFGDALKLRCNHPHLVPEVHTLAALAMDQCGIEPDAIVDDVSPPYPHRSDYDLDELTTRGYATLMRFQRGRVSHRDIFGPVRLHYGLFMLRATRSNYLLAREKNQIAGAVGFTVDEVEKTVRVFELVSRSDQPVRFLLDQLMHKCREEWGIEYVEVDVNAFAPRMQRTLIELDFLPVAYVPALAFHDVERLDAVKMVRLLVPYEPEQPQLVDQMKPIADLVLSAFASRNVLPRVAEAAAGISLFADMTHEQVQHLASACRVLGFQLGERIFTEDERDGNIYMVLSGQVAITVGDGDAPVGKIGAGECLGEMSLLCGSPHSATATAISFTEAAVLAQQDLRLLVRHRPDIGVTFYHNLAVGLGEKLWRSDQSFASRE